MYCCQKCTTKSSYIFEYNLKCFRKDNSPYAYVSLSLYMYIQIVVYIKFVFTYNFFFDSYATIHCLLQSHSHRFVFHLTAYQKNAAAWVARTTTTTTATSPAAVAAQQHNIYMTIYVYTYMYVEKMYRIYIKFM